MPFPPFSLEGSLAPAPRRRSEEFLLSLNSEVREQEEGSARMADESTPPAMVNLAAGPSSSCSSFIGDSGTTTASATTSDGTSTDLFEMQRSLIHLELQTLIDRYDDSFRQLQLTVSDLEALRQENALLVSENLELSSLVEVQEKSESASSSAAVYSANPQAEIGNTPISCGEADHGPPAGEENAPTSRSVLPKSISIRSSGFLAARRPPPREGDAGFAGACRPLRLRLQGEGEGEGEGEREVEVDAYNQGTAKTELCNKWGEMGWCPYGERCQFAHGIQELRPVIRHPRYKTQLCRMLGATGGCPYGHRCHFRHAALPVSDDR